MSLILPWKITRTTNQICRISYYHRRYQHNSPGLFEQAFKLVHNTKAAKAYGDCLERNVSDMKKHCCEIEFRIFEKEFQQAIKKIIEEQKVANKR
jgi:hypothetical protein